MVEHLALGVLGVLGVQSVLGGPKTNKKKWVLGTPRHAFGTQNPALGPRGPKRVSGGRGILEKKGQADIRLEPKWPRMILMMNE